MAKAHGVDVGRLCAAMRRARLVLRRYRQERTWALRQYVGRHWGSEFAADSQERVPVNLLSLYTSVVGRNLIAKNPQVLLSTFAREHKATVAAMQEWVNDEVVRMGLADTLQRVVLDALFGPVGICKVALSTPQDAAQSGWNTKAGTPFAERVDLDDFVFDVHARDLREPSYVGHRYRVPLDSVRDSKLYSKLRKNLQAATDGPYNLEGDERATALQRGAYAGDGEEFEEMADLWEVYVPRRRLVLTLAADAGGAPSGDDDALRAQEWLGPDCGPYHFLAYGVVPGNAMPKGPIMDLIDLHELANRLFRKLGRQGERQKEVVAFAGGSAEDAVRVQNAGDGDVVRVDNLQNIQAVDYGGANAKNFALFKETQNLFGYMAGNLDMMGGLSPQSKTLGQDQMLAQNASRAVADMQDRTVSFTGRVAEALCWFWHHHPSQVYRSVHSLPGLPDLGITRRVTPERRRRVLWADLKVKVDPYSLQHATPQGRAQALTQLVTQVILPMMPLLKEQGIAFDVNAFLAKLAAYLDMPDLGEIVTIQGDPRQEGPQQSGPDKPGMPAQTERRYVRENVPMRTNRGDSQNLVNSLMGVDQGGAPQGESQGMGG